MKKTISIAAFGLGLLLTGCAPSAPTPSQHYTGEAKVISTSNSGAKRGCYLKIKLPNGQTDSIGTQRRASCDRWPDGKTIQLRDGVLV